VAVATGAPRRLDDPLPDSPPGTDGDLREIVRLILGRGGGELRHPFAARVRQLAAGTLGYLRDCRASPNAAPALKRLERVAAQARGLVGAINALPSPFDEEVLSRLQTYGFQVDAFDRLFRALDDTASSTRERITGHRAGRARRGPGRLLERLEGDALPFLAEQVAQMLGEARGEKAISGDRKGELFAVTDAIWRFATGQGHAPDLERTVARIAKPARLRLRAHSLELEADRLTRAGLPAATTHALRRGGAAARGGAPPGRGRPRPAAA
jgi:hypothetical protein